jgi:hypothetical protein
MPQEILNALIRRQRDDRIAYPIFVKVCNEPKIWVRELPEDFEAIVRDLSNHHHLLRELKNQSSDYTLHLAANFREHPSLSIPPTLSRIAHECGFTIEVTQIP